MPVNIKHPPWISEQSLEVLDSVGDVRRPLHHALLITGPAGGGQRELAQTLAAAFLCERRGPGRLACGGCHACRWLSEGSHPDFRWIRPEADQPAGAEAPTRSASSRTPRASREILIDQIRALAGFVELASHRGSERVILIDPADAMNAAAANALLKTLEEPPPSVRFLLTSDRPERLTATIRSRCRKLPVRRPSTGDLRVWLSESIETATPAGIDAALAVSGGAPYTALAFLREGGAQMHERVGEALAALPEADPLGTAELLAAQDPEPLMRALHAWIVDLGRIKMGGDPIHFAARAERLRQIAARVDLAGIGRFEQILLQQLRVALHPLNARLLIEDTLLQYRAIFSVESPRRGGPQARPETRSARRGLG